MNSKWEGPRSCAAGKMENEATFLKSSLAILGETKLFVTGSNIAQVALTFLCSCLCLAPMGSYACIPMDSKAILKCVSLTAAISTQYVPNATLAIWHLTLLYAVF